MIHDTLAKVFLPFEYTPEQRFVITATPSMPKRFESGILLSDSEIKRFPIVRSCLFGSTVKVAYYLVKPRSHDVDIQVPDSDKQNSGSRILIVHGGEDKFIMVRVHFNNVEMVLKPGGYVVLDSINGVTIQHPILSGGIEGVRHA